MIFCARFLFTLMPVLGEDCVEEVESDGGLDLFSLSWEKVSQGNHPVGHNSPYAWSEGIVQRDGQVRDRTFSPLGASGVHTALAKP